MDSNVSVEEMCLEWLDSIEPSLKPSTYASYSFFTYSHILPYFKGKLFKNVTNKDVNAFLKAKSSEGRLDGTGGLAPSSMRCLVKVLKLVFKYAEDMYDIPYCIKKVNLPKQSKKEVEVFTQTEQDKIIMHVMANNKLPYFAILLSLYTGMRVGEVCALTWSNIDMVNSVINVVNTVERIQNVDKDGIKGTKLVLHSAKSDASVRKIPIPVSFKEKVLVPLQQKYATSDSIYFVTGKLKHSEPRYLQRHFSVLLDECGIPRKNFHTLRHTFATNCVKMGFDIKTLSELLGHSDVSITLNTYVHSSLETKQDYMNLLTI
jgi:integrase